MSRNTTRILFVLIVTLGVLVVLASASRADSGWVRYKPWKPRPFVRWTMPLQCSDPDVDPDFCQAQRAKAIRRARRAHFVFIIDTNRTPYFARIAIRFVFGPYRFEAYSVGSCESGLNVWAVNGQYRGIFQMGSSERARFGHGPNALDQARGAYRYFVASGRDWSPWSCKP